MKSRHKDQWGIGQFYGIPQLQDRFKYQPVINFATIGRDQLTLPDKGLITFCGTFQRGLLRVNGFFRCPEQRRNTVKCVIPSISRRKTGTTALRSTFEARSIPSQHSSPSKSDNLRFYRLHPSIFSGRNKLILRLPSD